MRDIFFRPGAYYIEFVEREGTGVLVVAALHRSARAVLHRIDRSKDDDLARWMGVALSGDNRPRSVTKGRLLFLGDPLRDDLHVIPMEDFVSLVNEVEQATPNVLADPPINQEVLEHTGSEVRHILCADVLAYKAIVESNPGITTKTRILPRPGLEEATFGEDGIEVESTSAARSGPAHLVFLAHQLSNGRFGQLNGRPKEVGFCADHVVVASDGLYGVYKEPRHVLEASIHAIRWCLQSVDPISYHHAMRIGVASGTSVRLCESNDDAIVSDLRAKGHVVAMYYGTGYVNAYLAEQNLCKGRGPCIVVAPSFCEQIAGQIGDLLNSGRLVPHPKEEGAFDVNWLIDLSDEEVKEYRARLEYFGQAYHALAPMESKGSSQTRFATSLRELDHYDELRKRNRIGN